MTGESGAAGIVVDARGLRCPIPVIRLAAAAQGLPPGTVVTVLATDPATRHDVPAWARMRGHGAPQIHDRAGADGATEFVLRVRLGPDGPGPDGPDGASTGSDAPGSMAPGSAASD